DTLKGMAMFQMEGINIPVLGIVENMAYFTPAELPDNKYYIFGKGGGQRLAGENAVPFLGEIPLVKSIADAGDNGMPITLDAAEPVSEGFARLAGRVAQDRKSTRLNSSHVKISYAVFLLKKKVHIPC